jgi:hypothetical protein
MPAAFKNVRKLCCRKITHNVAVGFENPRGGGSNPSAVLASRHKKAGAAMAAPAPFCLRNSGY